MDNPVVCLLGNCRSGQVQHVRVGIQKREGRDKGGVRGSERAAVASSELQSTLHPSETSVTGAEVTVVEGTDWCGLRRTLSTRDGISNSAFSHRVGGGVGSNPQNTGWGSHNEGAENQRQSAGKQTSLMAWFLVEPPCLRDC